MMNHRMYRSHFLSVVVMLLIAGFFAVASLRAAALSQDLVLENDHVKFVFDKERLGLTAMIDKENGVNHINAIQGSHLLWEIDLRQGIQEEKITNISRPRYDPPPEYTSARIESLPDGTQRAILEWNGVDWWREKGALDIKVTVELPKESGIAQWRISAQNRSAMWGVWTVKFPYVNGFLKSGRYAVAKPFGNSGYLYKDCSETVTGLYPGGGWGMEFISINTDNNGIYWAALDPWSQKKDFSVNPGTEGYFLHYTENMGAPGAGYPDFYPVAFGVYRGGWLEASKIYRKWALKQVWAEKGPMSGRSSTPDIMKNIGLWFSPGWSFGADEEASPLEMNKPLLDALDYLKVPIAIHWYNWHHNVFDNEYPHFLPPKPGFRERVRELVDRGVLVMPYINGMIADCDLPDIDKYLPNAVRDEAGGLRTNTWGFSSGRTFYMCPQTEFWRDRIAMLVDSLTGYYGVNGVYIDMIGAAAPQLCFDKSHGHPLGGGRWWIDGYRDMLERVQKFAHSEGRNAVITTENTAEPWMNVLDGFLAWIKPDDREVPMLEAVYSGYTYYFTAASFMNTGDRAYIMAQGRATIWGLQPTRESLALFQPEHKGKAAFVKRIGEYRVALKKYLSYGELLGPLAPANELETITESWPSHRNQPRNGTLPCAMGALWKAEDGNIGVFLVNYQDTKQDFTYTVDPSKYGFTLSTGEEYVITQISPEGDKELGVHYPAAITRTETIPPRDFTFIEIGRRAK